MEIIGIFNNNLCILIKGANIIIEPKLSKSDLDDLIEYKNVKVFNSFAEVITAAYGPINT